MSETNKANEITLTRLYDAPVNTVWEAWVDSDQVAHWWGPRGFTLTTHSKDFRTGGHWRYTMHGPNGTDFPNHTKYLEIDKYSRMVYDHGGNADKPPMFRVTVLFSEAKGQTKMVMTMALPTPEAAQATRTHIKKAGGEATWDRLAEYLAKKSGGKEQFVINRSFDAPLKVMYTMWSKPEQVMRWAPPIGMTMQFIRSDIRAGATSFYCMTGNADFKMYGRSSYLEMNGTDKLVYTQQFCDEKEKISRHPFAPTWPDTMLSTVKLTEEGPDRTRVTVTWEPHGKVTATELEAFVKERVGMTQGWTGSFDKLEDYLAKKNKMA